MYWELIVSYINVDIEDDIIIFSQYCQLEDRIKWFEEQYPNDGISPLIELYVVEHDHSYNYSFIIDPEKGCACIDLHDDNAPNFVFGTLPTHEETGQNACTN